MANLNNFPFLFFLISVTISCKPKKMEKDEKKIDQVENDDDYELVPPDGGWGWLVLMGSMMVNILIPGTIKSFGVLFVEFLEAFQASPSEAAWIPALCYFLYSSLGEFFVLYFFFFFQTFLGIFFTIYNIFSINYCLFLSNICRKFIRLIRS